MARVLIMEDEPNIALMLRVVFSDEGHQVKTVSDGKAGLEYLQHNLPDIAFIDLNMPGIGGRAVIETMHSNPVWRDIPIVLMTGSLVSSELLCTEKAIKAVLSKPFDLWDAVREVAELASA